MTEEKRGIKCCLALGAGGRRQGGWRVLPSPKSHGPGKKRSRHRSGPWLVARPTLRLHHRIPALNEEEEKECCVDAWDLCLCGEESVYELRS